MATFQTESQRALQSALNRLAAAKKAAIASGGKASGIPDASNSFQSWADRAWESGPGMAPHKAQVVSEPLAIRTVHTVPIDNNNTGMPPKPGATAETPPWTGAMVTNPKPKKAATVPPVQSGSLSPKEVAVPYNSFTTVGYGGGNHPGGVDYRLVPQQPPAALAAIDAATGPHVLGTEPMNSTGSLTRRLQAGNSIAAIANNNLGGSRWWGSQTRIPVEANAYTGAQQMADTGSGAMFPGPDPVMTNNMAMIKRMNDPWWIGNQPAYADQYGGRRPYQVFNNNGAAGGSLSGGVTQDYNRLAADSGPWRDTNGQWHSA